MNFIAGELVSLHYHDIFNIKSLINDKVIYLSNFIFKLTINLIKVVLGCSSFFIKHIFRNQNILLKNNNLNYF